MNKKGQTWAILLFAAFFFMIVLFATIEPFKENLDVVRSGTNLNCKGVSTFNQTRFDEHNDLDKLIFRPPCVVTGLSMIWFVFAFLFALATWVVAQTRRLKRK